MTLDGLGAPALGVRSEATRSPAWGRVLRARSKSWSQPRRASGACGILADEPDGSERESLVASSMTVVLRTAFERASGRIESRFDKGHGEPLSVSARPPHVQVPCI